MTQSAELFPLQNLKLLRFPLHKVAQRELLVMEAEGESKQPLPYVPRRIFTVRAKIDGEHGGAHAHYYCQQLLLPLIGEIDVICRGLEGESSDKSAIIGERRFILSDPNQGLLIPAGIWGEQIYRKNGDLLLVLCDLIYDPQDYMRDWQKYVEWVKITAAQSL
ncbi:MAG: FdtA/QdtA family cupin domain-containing protein [Alphaproteobacteria bacterium]|nr:FdtA/QdtA family cupin domain-containing protein [Alphaproteobacteria bacterium]